MLNVSTVLQFLTKSFPRPWNAQAGNAWHLMNATIVLMVVLSCVRRNPDLKESGSVKKSQTQLWSAHSVREWVLKV